MPSMRCFALLVLPCVALDVSWLPADGSAPLPLSARYREKLRSLCSLMESSSTLPPELAARQSTLRAQCAKLAADDANAGTASAGGGWPAAVLLALLAVAAFSYLQSSQQGRGGGFSTSSRPVAPPTQAQVDAAREARLRRFAQPVQGEANETTTPGGESR